MHSRLTQGELHNSGCGYEEDFQTASLPHRTTIASDSGRASSELIWSATYSNSGPAFLQKHSIGCGPCSPTIRPLR